MDEIDFPAGASERERNVKWEKLGEVADADFGFSDLVEGPEVTRYSVRVLLLNERGEICMLKSMKYGYFQMPGGGVELGENLEEALKREAREETGFEIFEIKPLGYFCEHREGAQNTFDYRKIATFAFVARAGAEVGTEYTDDEKGQGFAPVWLEVNEALKIFQDAEGKKESYAGHFENRRDLTLMRALAKWLD